MQINVLIIFVRFLEILIKYLIKMNSAVIIKLEFRFPDKEQFTPIDYTGFSANLSEKTGRSFPGVLHTATLQFRIPKCDTEKDRLMLSLSQRRAIYQATDANGAVYVIGTKKGAQLLYNRSVEGKAGSFNGYEAVITFDFKGAPLIT